MERIAVKSSSLVAIGYDPSTLTFEAEFPGKDEQPGPLWQYAPVDVAVYASMLLPGASVGRIFHREIKSNPDVVATRVDEVTA